MALGEKELFRPFHHAIFPEQSADGKARLRFVFPANRPFNPRMRSRFVSASFPASVWSLLVALVLPART